MTSEPPFTDGRTTARGRLAVENVGGIARADVTFSEGVTLVAGENASNKSSFLRALAGVLGGPVPPLKSDAGTGAVRLWLDGAEHHLQLERRDGETVVADGAPYASARELCELFVALTESNPIRRAVVAGEDLGPYLMAPVDTAAIEAEIERLRTERAELDDRLEELDGMAARLPGLQTRRESIASDLADTEAALRDARDAVEELEAATEAPPDDGTAADLREKRSERNEIRDRIRTQETAIESLESELAAVGDRLESLGDVDADTTVEEIETELESLHYRKQQLTSTINVLGSVVEMNGRILDDGADIPDALRADGVVSELDPATDAVTCWTCGSTVDRARIAEQADTVRSIVREKRNERDTITGRIQVLTERRRELEAEHEERAELRDRRADLTAELERRRETLEGLEADRRELETEIERLQRAGEATTEDDARLTELYDEIGDLEYERGQLASDLESVEAEIAEIEAAIDDREEVAARRASVVEELRNQRERIDGIERDLVDTFNQTMQRVLETLSYGSIERVWLERQPGDGSRSAFELHVVRESEDGTVYEDTVDTLSKSERAVVGLVVALAGYLVHDVAETVPFVAIDAVEMLDASRIGALVELFADHADHVVATVLPAERAEMEGEYELIRTAEFTTDG